MQIIHYYCCECDANWWGAVDDIEEGIAESIYKWHNGEFHVETCCGNCLARVREESGELTS